jgi:hypothetical protein
LIGRVLAMVVPAFWHVAWTTFMLRDMADFRRFVMTFCYDSTVLEAKKLTKPFIYKDWSG